MVYNRLNVELTIWSMYQQSGLQRSNLIFFSPDSDEDLAQDKLASQYQPSNKHQILLPTANASIVRCDSAEYEGLLFFDNTPICRTDLVIVSG